MKYELDRLGPDAFEHLIQSLIRGVAGNGAIIFGDGPDGQREAVIEHANHKITGDIRAQGLTIVQAKFKSPEGQKSNWDWLRDNLQAEMDGFQKKSASHPHLIPETFLFFTNIILTPVLDKGTRDRAEQFVLKYKDLIPNIIILGADDIRAMLDNNREVARSYASFIMPGDVLTVLYKALQILNNEKFEDLIEYARQMFHEDNAVRLEQAGSVSSKTINVRNIYTDLEARAINHPGNNIEQIAAYIIELGNRVNRRKSRKASLPGSTLSQRQHHAPEYNIVLIGNAGQGKSTLCQYICQLYRAALLKRFKPEELDTQQYSSKDSAIDLCMPRCERFPVLINLKRYAAWISKQEEESAHSVIAYILSIINGRTVSSISIHDFRRLLSGYSWVFLFDGLDEVPVSSNRGEVIRQIQVFLEADLIEASCDSLVICTSRPQGYDDAFSTAQYNHYELKDMSRPLCESYIEKLLNYLEDNSDERERYRQILHNALDDPMISNLMTTPLYTAIIALLVKMGGTPPNKRYTLFQEYCDIVVKRELQKDMLPSLHDEHEWIRKLHAQIGFILQTESETVDNAAAELPSIRCQQLIKQFIANEGYDGDASSKATEIYTAITNRLPFLSLIAGADQGACLIFPLRSIQEYFAAEWLISFDDENKLSEALEIISVSAYWRNVYLFVAGYFAKNPNRRNINEALFRICQRNNGDENYANPNTTKFCITMQGAWLALDLLCDNLFSHPNNQRRYLNIASQLLNWNHDIPTLMQHFLRLPAKIAEVFLKEKVIPHVQNYKDSNGIAFRLLWHMANNGNDYACEQLEALIDNMPTPDETVILKLLVDGYDGVGDKIVSMLYHWIVDERFEQFCITSRRIDDSYWHFLSYFYTRLQDITPSSKAIRQAVYKLMSYSRYGHKRLISEGINYPNRLIQKIIEDESFELSLFHGNVGNSYLRYHPITSDRSNLCYSAYIEEFRLYHLDELAALFEFLISPSICNLHRILDVYDKLLEDYRKPFLKLLRRCNWLLRDIASELSRCNSLDTIYSHYDEVYFKTCLKKDREMVTLIESGDIIAIIKSNDLDKTDFVYSKSAEDITQELLCITKEMPVTSELISLLEKVTDSCENLSPELIHFGVQHFSSLFYYNGRGINFALRLFVEMTVQALIASPLNYPKEINMRWWIYPFDASKSNEVLTKIDYLAEIGEDFLDVYALLPLIYEHADYNRLSGIPSNKLIQYYYAIDISGNRAALLGCILRILFGNISDEMKYIIRNRLLEFLQTNSTRFLWFSAAESLSMDGKMLIYEIISMPNANVEYAGELRSELAFAILEELESQPVNHEELIVLAESAHSI